MKRILSLLVALMIALCPICCLADSEIMELQSWMGLTPQELAAALPDPIIEDDSVTTADYGLMAMSDTAFGSINYMLLASDAYSFSGLCCGTAKADILSQLAALDASADESSYASDGCIVAVLKDGVTLSLYFDNDVLINLCAMKD